MSNKFFHPLLAAAAVGVVALGPLAAQAQSQHQQPSRQSTEQHSHSSSQDRDRSNASQNHGQQDQGRQEQGRQAGRYRITSTVNLRSGPGTNNRRVGQLRAGQVVQVDQVRNGWLHISGRGWISAQFARRA